MDVTTAQNLFRPAEGGYVFRTPYRLGFGKVSHYLVSESEKAELTAAIAGPDPATTRAKFALAGAGAMIAAVVLVAVLSPHKDPTIADAAAMLLLIAAFALPVAALWRSRQMRRIAPLLARLRPSDQQITRAEMRRTMFRRMAATHIRLTAVLCATAGFANLLLGAYSIAGGRTGSSTSPAAGAIFVGVGIYYALNAKYGRKTARTQNGGAH